MAPPTLLVKLRTARGSLRVALILLAAVGCFISLVLLRLSIPSETPATIFGHEVCAPSATVDCGHVLYSRWARMGPVPVAALGLAYFAAIAAWFLFVPLPNRRGRRWHLVPVIFISLGLCGSLHFLNLMAFHLPVWCTWCIAAHVVNALIFVLACLTWPRAPTTPDAAAETQVPVPTGARVGLVSAAIAVLLLLIVGTGTVYKTQVLTWQCRTRLLEVTNDIDYIEWRYRQAPERDIPVYPDDLVMGPANARWTVVTFTDFECPKCRSFFISAGRLVERFPATLRCVFKHCPISSDCNPHATGSKHHFSCEAALAAVAAHTVGTPRQVRDYHQALYNNMARFDERPYPQLAARLGLDPAGFTAAVDADETRDRLEADITLAHELGIERTPTIFLNGRELPTWKIVLPAPDYELDVDRTVALWERLLGQDALQSQAHPPNKNSDAESADD